MAPNGYEGSVKAFDVVVERGVRVVARDGVELATDVYRPAFRGAAVDGRFPTVLMRTPYDRTRPSMHLSGQFFAGRGYAFVAQDSRGRFDSGGEFHFLFNPHHEGLDGHDTVEWIAAQSWSDGKVGTTGLSFEGATQQAMAVTRPPHLTTQIILDAGYNYFKRPVRHAGAFTEAIFLPYVFFMAMVGNPEVASDPARKQALREVLERLPEWTRRLPLRRGESPLALAPAYEQWYFDMATRGDWEEFWRNPSSSMEDHIDLYPDIPVLLVTSWYGHHAWANTEKWRALRARNTQPVRLVCGIWTHGAAYMQDTAAGEVEFGASAAVGYLDDVRLRWFDRFLKGLDTGVDEGEPVELFVMGGGTGRAIDGGVRGIDRRLDHGGRWRREPDFPLPRAAPTPYYLHADGALRLDAPASREAATSYTYDPADPVPTIGGCLQNPIGVSGLVYGGAFDQRGRRDLFLCRDTLPLAARQDVLVFRSDPLEDDAEVTGPVEVRLWVSSSAVDTDFTAKLVDEYPPSADWPVGFSLNLVDSIVRMRYRDWRPVAELIEPGRVYEITIGPMYTSNLFARGHRIRLDVSSSSHPQFDVNPNTGAPLLRSNGVVVARNTVHHDRARASHLLLPLVPVDR